MEKLSFPEISEDEIKILSELGHGACGKIYKGKCRGKIVAVKELNLKKDDKEAHDKFKSEVSIMVKLRHPNIVLFMGACLDPCLIVQEYLSGGDLDGLLKSGVPLTIHEIQSLAKDICLGMNWLHCSIPPIIHKDLKPANILIDEKKRAKVADFGLSVIQQNVEKQRVKYAGSVFWMAPEMLLMKEYDVKIDVYAFGIILWQLISNSSTPYKADKYENNIAKFMQDVIDLKKRPNIPAKVDNSLKTIMESCWEHDPKLRPSFSDILTMLDESILTTTLQKDMDAIKMWKSLTSGRETVPIDEFLDEFYKVIKEPFPVDDEEAIIRLKCLKAIIDDKEVTLERFGLILIWFGPMIRLGSKTNILDKIHDIMQNPWFHGDISRDESQEMLSGHKGGSWLVRTSNIPQFPFTLSCAEQIKGKKGKTNSIIHHRLGFNATTGDYSYSIKQPKAKDLVKPSLNELLKSMKKLMDLGKPLQRNKYNHIFTTNGMLQDNGYMHSIPDNLIDSDLSSSLSDN